MRSHSQSRRRVRRPVPVGALVGLGTLLGVLTLLVPPGPPAPGPASRAAGAVDVRPAALEQPPPEGGQIGNSERGARRATVRALAVLHGWDARRGAAWERGDLAGLARLYTARSLAGRRDVALLRRYVERDRPVDGEPPRVLRADLEDGAAGTLRLRVVEQGDAQRRPDARVVVLVRRGDDWRVDRVRAA